MSGGRLRVAAVGDLHGGTAKRDIHAGWTAGIAESADLLLLAGDLTRRGEPDEAAELARDLRDVQVPVVAVLGNHDLESDQTAAVRGALEDVGVTVLEGENVRLEVGGVSVGVAGTIGFGAGFPGAICSDFGERELKAVVARSRRLARDLRDGLIALQPDVRIALTHYSPVRETLEGEPLEIYPFLGSHHLSEAIDQAGADLAIHGHAHRGSEWGRTPGGVPVRNVAHPVIRTAYRVYNLEVGRHGPPMLADAV
jgi:Icc-related predicted phosphoesterase